MGNNQEISERKKEFNLKHEQRTKRRRSKRRQQKLNPEGKKRAKKSSKAQVADIYPASFATHRDESPCRMPPQK
jgi:hypothetical protein